MKIRSLVPVLTIVLATSCAPSPKSPLSKSAGPVIGRLHIDPASPKYLVVRGQRLTGDIVFTYHDGYAWANDVCLSTVPPTSEDDVWNRLEPLDPSTLSDADVARIAQAPYVRARVAAGASAREAVAAYCAAQDRMMESVKATYLGQPCGGPTFWEPKAIAKIDTRIAEARLDARNPPRLGRGDWISVWFEGMGYRRVAVPKNMASDEADTVSLQYAKNVVFMIDQCLKEDRSLVLVSSMANYNYGNDTDKAIEEYEALNGRVSANLVSREKPIIDPFLRTEILAYAHGHRGDL
jgi:hypothetical protein